MENLTDGLNAAQYEAVTATEGFIRVLAGAGSGKTRALTHRFAWLVNELGILPGNILCVTFTNKAANEMRKRIHSLTGDNDTGYINTFHGFCVSILQEDSHTIGYPKSFLVLDNSDIDTMLGTIYEERGLTLRDKTFKQARDMIEILKLFKKPDYYLDMIELPVERLKEKYDRAVTADDIIFYGYLYQEKKCFGVDYNDLLLFSLYIFQQYPEICLKWQKRLEYIMIDEFQDIDEPQYKLMRVLCGYHKNLFVVGDPDQTIYTWRGASGKYLMHFEDDFPGARTIMMMQNYRSTPQILSVCNSLISKNENRIPKDLIPVMPDGPSVLCHRAENAEAEAVWIGKKLQELHAGGTPYRDMAILYRAHYLTRPLEDCFLQESIPYSIYSGVQFFDRAEIKDSLCYLRMLLYQDDLSFLRIANQPKRNLGKKRMKFLQEYAGSHSCSLYSALKQNEDTELFRGTGAGKLIKLVDRWSTRYDGMTASDVLTGILTDSGYEEMLRTEGSQERLDNLAELKQTLYDFEASSGEENTLEYFLSHAALFSNLDADSGADRVKLMTVHTAKGLEFPYVFLCSMDEGVFPSKKVRTRPEMEEERRLAFVAMTRAELALFLSSSDGRTLDGSPKYPSRFLLDIDSPHFQYTSPPREGLLKEAAEYAAQISGRLTDGTVQAVFTPGTRVRHAIFGDGTVVSVDEEKPAYTVKFDMLDTPRQLSFKVKLTAV